MKMIGIGLILTLVVYIIARKFYQRFPYPFFVPVLTSTVIIVTVLILFQYPYEQYMKDVSVITELLGAAIVALGYPLYKQWHVIKKYFVPIMSGVVVGTWLGIESGRLLSKALKVEDLLTYSLLPKSVTTPVAMEIAEEIGGIPSLAAVFVMVAGISCVVIGPYLLKWLRIDSPLEVGIGYGSAAHVLGTSKALEFGEDAAAISSVSMTMCAVIASFLAPVIIALFG